MRILFIGSVTSSEEFLKSILPIEDVEICGIVSKSTSTFNSDFVSLLPYAESAGIPSFDFSTESHDNLIQWTKDQKPQVIYCLGWSHLLSEEILGIPELGAVGYHPAALPANRGRHPIIWSLALGLSETASTFFKITSSADEGDIISQSRVEIERSDDADSLYKRLINVGKIQVQEFTQSLTKTGSLVGAPQNPSLGNTWRKRSKLDGIVDWRMPSEGIFNLVRALKPPYPGALFTHDGREFAITDCQTLEESFPPNFEPGKILDLDLQSAKIIVKTGDGAVSIITDPALDVSIGSYL